MLRQGICTCNIHCSITCEHTCCPINKYCTCWCHEIISNTSINCNHIPSIPISRKGELYYWQCSCGNKREYYYVAVEEKQFLKEKYKV